VQELVQGGTSLVVTFEQPDIEWCRCRSWCRVVPAWMLPLSSQILSGAGAGGGAGAAVGAWMLPLSSQILSGAGAGAGTGAALPAWVLPLSSQIIDWCRCRSWYRCSATSLGVTFEQPDIEWCRFRSWYRCSPTSQHHDRKHHQKQRCLPKEQYTVKKITIFPSPAGMSLIKFSLAGNN
jgi:hypothetical protein